MRLAAGVAIYLKDCGVEEEEGEWKTRERKVGGEKGML